MQTSDPSIWHLMFEQTPPITRWALILLTGGLFGLAMWVYRWQQRSVHARIDHLEKRMDDGFKEVNRNIMELARQERH